MLRVVLAVPGSRTLKDRRQVIRSLRDRVRARFEVSVHEEAGENPGRQALIVTTGGSERGAVERALDAVSRFLYESRDAWPVTSESDVQRWQPPALTGPEEDPDG